MPLTTVSTTATSGSVATSPPSTRGNYRRFQVRTRGTAGASYYSGWKVSTNSVRRNTAPKAPTTAVASPAAYSDETITLTWSGASGGTSPVKGYQIARRASTDNSTWSAWNVLTTLTLAASGGSYNPNVSRVPGTYTQFGIWTIDTFDVYSVEKISNSIFCDITACGAPTVCTVSATLSEGNVTLSWSGASGGAGNAITSYEIQYSDSTDNSDWGDWIALTTVSTSATSSILSVSPPSTRGNYRRFRIRTRGAAGESFYSDWTVSSNTVRRNTLPTPPTSFTATPTIYESATVTLSWSGTIPGTSAIKQYVIQRSTSTDGINWSAYEALTIVVSNATSGTYITSASQIAGTYTRYRISVTDTLDAVSGYVVSGNVKKNSPPTAPAIVCPVSGSSGYNTTPRFMITTGIEPDGQTQIVEVKIDAEAWVAGWILYALIAFVVIDYVTGVLCAIIDKKLSSEIGAKGIFKKVLIFALVGVAHILDTQILSSTGDSGGVLRTAVVFFYLSNEGVSILENAAHIGLPIPGKLKDVLKQLHGRDQEPSKPGDEND